MIYIPWNLWNKPTVGNRDAMKWARVHHMGPYSENLATDYTEDYTDGEPGISVGKIDPKEKLPWLQAGSYITGIGGGAVLGYMATTFDRTPKTRSGKRRKRKKELSGMVAGALIGALAGAVASNYVWPFLLLP